MLGCSCNKNLTNLVQLFAFSNFHFSFVQVHLDFSVLVSFYLSVTSFYQLQMSFNRCSLARGLIQSEFVLNRERQSESELKRPIYTHPYSADSSTNRGSDTRKNHCSNCSTSCCSSNSLTINQTSDSYSMSHAS